MNQAQVERAITEHGLREVLEGMDASNQAVLQGIILSALRAKISDDARRPEELTPILCSQHGGYGFASDCRVCNAAPAGVPAKETSGDDQRNDAEVDGRAQLVKEAGSLVTGRECGTRSDAVCDEREVRKSGYDPRRDAAPVAWRWRNTTHWNPEAWNYGAQRPTGPGESVFIVEALYAGVSPQATKDKP